jgi:hypothetical protein
VYPVPSLICTVEGCACPGFALPDTTVDIGKPVHIAKRLGITQAEMEATFGIAPGALSVIWTEDGPDTNDA